MRETLRQSTQQRLLIDLEQHTMHTCALTALRQKNILIKKLNNLYCGKSWEFHRSTRVGTGTRTSNLDKLVVNLSSKAMDDHTKLLLAKGLNFVPAPKCPPILDIVASVEQSLFKTEPQQAEAIKQALASFLLINNNKVAEPNLTTMEKKALKDLNRDNSILITKADKGNTVVVLDRSAYLEKMSEMLMRNVYKPIRADPTSKLRTDLLNLLDMFISETNDEALVKIKQHLYFTSNIKCPEMYGLPKTHKLGIPMRPVVASINSVTSKLCSYLKEIIRPLTGLRMSYVKNSKHFCDDIKTLRLQGNEVLVSYDVKDLFTNIPIPKTLSVLKELLNNDITLVQRTKLNPFHVVKLASFCMHEGNYFRFQDRFFTQRNGVPMGSPLSPVLAEVFMEHFEQIAFDNINMDIRPICFKRYVDDIFAVIPTGAEEQFLEHLNRLYPENIVLTIEKETDKKLPFLDALVIRGDDRLTTKIYRKPTNPDAYLHFTSHHPLSVKKGIVAGMVDRAIAICDKNFLGEELQHIKRIFTENGYPFKLITSIINRRLRPKPPNVLPQQPRGPTVVLPYHSILGDTIKRLAKSLDFRVFFKSSPNLRAILRTDKIRIPKEEAKGVVYQIKCGCHASYIGETGNTLFDRFKEHLACVTRYKNARDRLSGAQPRRRGRPQTKEPTKIMEETIKASAIVEHSSQCSHDLQPRILCRESLFHHRKIKEACYIRHNASINRDRGTEISQAWTGLIDQTDAKSNIANCRVDFKRGHIFSHSGTYRIRSEKRRLWGLKLRIVLTCDLRFRRRQRDGRNYSRISLFKALNERALQRLSARWPKRALSAKDLVSEHIVANWFSNRRKEKKRNGGSPLLPRARRRRAFHGSATPSSSECGQEQPSYHVAMETASCLPNLTACLSKMAKPELDALAATSDCIDNESRLFTVSDISSGECQSHGMPLEQMELTNKDVTDGNMTELDEELAAVSSSVMALVDPYGQGDLNHSGFMKDDVDSLVAEGHSPCSFQS
uniref:Reverse transcriptase domain-containing protein n=1 Tax=Trichuris muris TaxID=70415 RepID=A0A5S6R1L5_TRIMR